MNISEMIEKAKSGKLTEEEKDIIIASYVNYKTMESEGKKGKEEIKPVVYAILGSKDEYTTENHKAWLKAMERKSFDEEGLKKKYPNIWKEFANKQIIISLYAK